MKKKKANGVQLLIRAVVRDPEGNVIQDTGEGPAKSFVIQFLEFIGAMFDGVSTSATMLSGGEGSYYVSSQSPYNSWYLNAPINKSTFGIQIGTGDTAEDNTDYKLATQLTEGAGAGNITHGAMVMDAVGVVGANVDVEFKRAFTNATGSTITVKEAGIVTGYGPVRPTNTHLIVRDVLAAPVEVPDKCSLTIIYTMRTTV